jgi:hypothetical protein
MKLERDIIPETTERFAAAPRGQSLDTLPWESMVCGSHVLPLILYLSGGMNASCSLPAGSKELRGGAHVGGVFPGLTDRRKVPWNG